MPGQTPYSRMFCSSLATSETVRNAETVQLGPDDILLDDHAEPGGTG